MIFSRTASGVSNHSFFSGVDLIIYSEGGTIDRENPEASWSIDSLFWKNIFSRFLPGIKIKVKSLGSKENVLPYAEGISSGEYSNSLAVLDRDHDSHKGIIIDHPRVLYTHGYSWENDAWRAGFMISLLRHNSPSGELPPGTQEDISRKVECFLLAFNRLIFVDVLCSLSAIKGIDRDSFWSFVSNGNIENPKISKQHFKRLIANAKEKREAPLRYTGNNTIKADRDCYGKLFAKFCYFVIFEHYKRMTKTKNLPKEYADQLIVANILAADFDLEPEIRDYYSENFSRLSGSLTGNSQRSG